MIPEQNSSLFTVPVYWVIVPLWLLYVQYKLLKINLFFSHDAGMLWFRSMAAHMFNLGIRWMWQSIFKPQCYIVKETDPSTHFIVGLEGTTTGLDVMEERGKLLLVQGVKPRFLGLQSVAQTLYRLSYPACVVCKFFVWF